ncbi:MAG: hypothetical protein KAU28_07125, partial [Phycisphaerae bacterium]|nr:hypothetical protein [Phycisphaerae bacterium]
TDVIVGFPSESDKDFAATLALARQAGFAKIHAFPFSAIEGTAAWGYRHEALPGDVVKARLAELAELEKRLAADYRGQFIGEAMEGLVENTRGSGKGQEGQGEGQKGQEGQKVRQAMTDRYITARFRADDEDLTGKVVRLRIKRITANGLSGQLLEIPKKGP